MASSMLEEIVWNVAVPMMVGVEPTVKTVSWAEEKSEPGLFLTVKIGVLELGLVM